MKLDILSQDRLGITQEILAAIVAQGCNLLAMEMQRFHTYVSIDTPLSMADKLTAALMQIDGVNGVQQVEWLPGERRRQHLDTLLSRLPDPIVDIDANGEILVANAAACEALAHPGATLEGEDIAAFLPTPKQQLLKAEGFSTELSTANGAFLLEATPVRSGARVNGAVVVLRSLQRVGQQLSAVQASGNDGLDSIVGESARIKTLRQQTLRFANLDLPVLIRGETGTGKELLARALHKAGPRNKAPFLAINCANLAENLLESELFGYASGAFSGAQKGGKPGLFELADSGTVFLDEIGEMSPYLQAKLLRFLEDFRFRRIGGTREVHVDVRIICATHRDLEQMTQTGEFREDLFYRLNVLNLRLPPLRERREDIAVLVQHFLKRACEQVNAPLMRFSNAAIKKLQEADWPGNIRQLQNTIFRTVALSESGVIEEIDLQQLASKITGMPLYQDKVTSLEEAMAQYEKQLLASLYQHYPSTRKLAERLAVSHAKIARKLKQYGIVAAK
ncbi:sigma 54-interacting transcriptional regulator [Aliiglaciecola sp. CAU 1673]|uniref:sigma 54-interacting transcriptional regulator n=1 Tax=Aliiglaciecola sp. CAU 1673 TaxID=3032595 RepID=UPI0023DC4446|nr:sigma 54-interacting transcriptional regulator [Aliiglaciecola sp. CAU 1673]MDF2180371.1 sigma 54-interacting transcriptional regulator [Aliiglaciecola sp. CAU 1673]